MSRPVDDFGQKNDGRITREAVFYQGVEEHSFAVVPELDALDVVGSCSLALSHFHHLICRHEQKLRLRVDELRISLVLATRSTFTFSRVIHFNVPPPPVLSAGARSSEPAKRLLNSLQMRMLAAAHLFVFRALQGPLIGLPRFAGRRVRHAGMPVASTTSMGCLHLRPRLQRCLPECIC